MIIEHRINPYPRTMWVAINENFDEIKSEFQFVYESDSKFTHKELEEDYDAIVFKVSKDNLAGYLVFIINTSSSKILVHEALHVALHIYQDCDMEISPDMDQEPLCYLTEYIYSLLENDKNSRSES